MKVNIIMFVSTLLLAVTGGLIVAAFAKYAPNVDSWIVALTVLILIVGAMRAIKSSLHKNTGRQHV